MVWWHVVNSDVRDRFFPMQSGRSSPRCVERRSEVDASLWSRSMTVNAVLIDESTNLLFEILLNISSQRRFIVGNLRNLFLLTVVGLLRNGSDASAGKHAAGK